MARPYESLFIDMGCARVDWPRGTIKVMLVTDDFTFKPEFQSRRSHVAEYECRGKGYIAGGVELSGKDVRKVNGRAVFSANNPLWPEVTIKPAGAVVYQAGDSGHLDRDVLICYEQSLDDDERPTIIPVTNGEFEITWPGGIVMGLGLRK